MNVLIAADMEGVAGIEGYGDCLPSHPAAYAEGRALMTAEVLAAVEALRAGGAKRISVGDWHMVGTNIERERMPAGVEVRPIAELALNVAEPSMAKAHGGPLDAVVFLGHHAGTRNPRAFCSHTFVWEMEVLLDGEPLNEVQVYAQALAAEGVPVLAASGDRWMLEELGPGELGTAPLVTTKEGRGRARAQTRPPAAAREELTAAIAGAIAAPGPPPPPGHRHPRATATPGPPPPPRSYPAELRILAEGEELVAATVAGPEDLLTAIASTFRTSQVSREYRQLAKLLPAEGSRLRSLHRRAGSLLATPVMRSKERSWLAAAPGSTA